MRDFNQASIDEQLNNICGHINKLRNSKRAFILKDDQQKSYKDVFSLAYNRRFELKKELASSPNALVGLINQGPLSLIINILSLWELRYSVVLFPNTLPDKELQRVKDLWKIKEIINDHHNYWTTNLTKSSNYKHYQLKGIDSHAITIMTSGSSGEPKGVMLSFQNLFASALGSNSFYNINQDDVWISPLPMHHIGGFMIFIRMLIANGSIFISDYKDLEEVLEKKRATMISLVPTQLEKLIEIKSLKNLKGIILGGAKTPDYLLKKACSLKLPLANSFGLSEMTAQVTSTPIGHDFEILKTGGKLLPFRNIAFHNNQIQYSGKTLFIGYQGDPHRKTSFLSNDLGSFDENSNFHFHGRNDHIFISGGENINPFDLENKISSALKLTQAFIVPVNHFRFGQVPFLFHSSKLKITRTMLKKYLLPHEIPYQFEAIPSNDLKNKIKFSRRSLQDTANKIFLDSSSPLSYKVSGDPSKEVIIFFHGFMGDKDDWDLIIKSVETNYFCVSIDLPGHGDTCTNPFNNFDDLIQQLILFVKSFEQKINLVGYSMGGRIAASLTAAIPELINKTLLESSAFGIEQEDEKKTRSISDQKLFSDIKSFEDLECFLDKWYELPLFHGIKNHSDYQKLLSKKSFSKIRGWKESLEVSGLAKMPFILPKLQKYDQEKLLLIIGQNDKKYLELARKSLLPYKEIQDNSHNIHFNDPQLFSKTLLRFLKR